jgi:hypothetical protein
MKPKLHTKFKHFDLIHNDGTVQDGKRVVQRNVLASCCEEVIFSVRDDYTHIDPETGNVSTQTTVIIRHTVLRNEHHITTRVERGFNGKIIASWKDKFIVVEAKNDDHYPENEYIQVFPH